MNPHEFQKQSRRANGSLRVQTLNELPSLTRQEFAEASDVNNIMKRYDNKINAVPFQALGAYADFSSVADYQSMLDQVIYAQQAFQTLPAETRRRFGNDPGQLLEFLQDKNNYDEGVKLGLLQKPEPAIKTNELNERNEAALPKTPKKSPQSPINSEE